MAEAESLLERLTAELADWNANKASHERGRDLAGALVESSSAPACRSAAPGWTRRWKAPRTRPTSPPPTARPKRRARPSKAPVPQRRRRARADHADAEAAEAQAREPLEAAEREVQRLSAEVKALGDLLHPEGEGLFPPLIDAVTVQSGYEAALAAALGDDLQAPLDESSPHHWRDLGAFDAIRRCPPAASR